MNKIHYIIDIMHNYNIYKDREYLYQLFVNERLNKVLFSYMKEIDEKLIKLIESDIDIFKNLK